MAFLMNGVVRYLSICGLACFLESQVGMGSMRRATLEHLLFNLTMLQDQENFLDESTELRWCRFKGKISGRLFPRQGLQDV